MSGKLIVIYGINNIGKSTQAKKLVKWLQNQGQNAQYLKYPLYDLAPSGSILNTYLRKGNPHNLTAREAQIIYALNRTQYDHKLRQILANNTHVVAEDYIGTSLAWGIGTGVEENFLKKINSHLVAEDMIILFNGSRFSQAIENGHKHETNEKLTQKVRHIHLDLAKKYGWQIINANQPIQDIHTQICQLVRKVINSG